MALMLLLGNELTIPLTLILHCSVKQSVHTRIVPSEVYGKIL